MPTEPFWEAHDTLELQLSSPPARDVAATLAVAVSFEAACPQRPSHLWKNKGEQHGELARLWGGTMGRAQEEGTQGQGQQLLSQPPEPGKSQGR